MRNEKTTHLVANHVPRYIRTKLVSVGNGDDPHETLEGLGPGRLLEHVLGVPVYELGPAPLGAHAGVVEVGFDLGNVVGAGLNSGGTRDTVVAGPEVFV